MAQLKNWSLMTRIETYGNSYQILIGDVYEHPLADKETGKLCNGHNVMTSKIVSLDLYKNIAITQSGTVYELGSKC